MTEQERLEELIKAHTARLHQLELRAAREGIDTPPAVNTEISAIGEKLRELTEKMKTFSSTVGTEVEEELGDVKRRLSSLSDAIPTERIEFINRLQELETVLKVISIPGHPNFIAVDAPAGYGKTYFLGKLREELKRKGWLCCWVDGKKIPRKNCKRAIAERILQDVSERGEERSRKLDPMLSIVRALSEYEKVVLLLDDVNRLPQECSEWVRDKFIPGLNKRRRTAETEFKVIVSGRHLMHEWVKGSFAPRFVQPLTPFSLEIIGDLVRRVSKWKDPKKIDIVARNIMDITGGHPQGIVGIVFEELNREENWHIVLDVTDEEEYYFSDEKREELFGLYVSPVLDEVGEELGENRDVFEVTSILRGFNDSILEGLLKKGLVHQFSEPSALRKWLFEAFLISSSATNEVMLKDKIMRDLFVARMRVKRKNWAKYRELNRIAAEIFDEKFDEFCDVLKQMWIPELALYLVVYPLESIYHHWEERYGLDDVDLAKHLHGDLDRIKRRIAGLGTREPYQEELLLKLKETLEQDPLYAEICRQIGSEETEKTLGILA